MSSNNMIAAYAASNHKTRPSRLGSRYDEERFLPEAGNTVVCHLNFDAEAHRAVIDARTRLQALPGAKGFLFTPVDSLHMTVFEGVIDTRRTPDAWPAGMNRQDPIEVVTDALIERLSDFTPPPDFAVRAVGVRPTGLVLAGASARDDANLLAWREALTEPFGYRHADHDDYGHHMTFAYPVDWIPDSVIPMWEEELASILTDLQEAAPTIPLTDPAFCRFADMTNFEELLTLRHQ